MSKPHARIFLYLAMTAACAGATSAAGDAAENPGAAGARAHSASTAELAAIPPESFLNNLIGMHLVDQHGRPFRPDALVDRVVLFNFIFTNCGSVCPLQTRMLAETFQALPADILERVRFVSLSIDPVNDTPQKLLQYSKAMHADVAGWSFLTGEKEQIDRLAERLRLFDPAESEENKPELHRTSLRLVDRQGRMLQRYRGDPPDQERLLRELAQVSHMTVR
jgi:cytochrome oxidase Cu insertion factor (SCO1/SenC/PrrC family)